MWDRITGTFSGLFAGGKLGALLGMAIGVIIGLMSPTAVTVGPLQAAVTGGFLYGMAGATVGAGLGVAKGLIFGSGEEEPESPDVPKNPEATVAAIEQAVEEPSHGLLSLLGVGGKDKGRGV